MSITDDPDFDAARLASDPRTDWETLHWIAENRPDLRPEVAANGNTYPELLAALAALGVPEIDAALSSREDAAREPETVEFHGPRDEPVEAQDSWQTETILPAVSGVERYELPAREPEPELDDDPCPADDGGAQELPAPAAMAAPAAPRHVPPAPRHATAGPSAADTLLDQGVRGERVRRSRPARVLVMVVLPLVAVAAVVVIGAMIWMQINEQGDPVTEAPQDQGADQQDQAEAEGGEAPVEGDEESPAVDEEALAEARTAVQSLPGESTCAAPGEDAEVIAEYASLAGEAESWTEQDEELLEFTFEDLQDACDTVHAAGVFHDLRGDEDSAETISGSLEEIGVGWADLAFPDPEATTMDSFVTPDGNVHCQWDETVRCSVRDFDFAPPAGCEEATTYRLSVDDGGTACDDPVQQEDREVLDHDDSAAIGVLVCVSLEDRVSCWNMIDGSGFEVSERGHYTYE